MNISSDRTSQEHPPGLALRLGGANDATLPQQSIRVKLPNSKVSQFAPELLRIHSHPERKSTPTPNRLLHSEGRAAKTLERYCEEGRYWP